MTDVLYQTLEDRSNPDEVERHGPYRCTNSDAWLGPGYYFWYYFIDLAHWWGRTVYPVTSYMICRQTGDIDGNPEILDLYADFGMIDAVRQYVMKIKGTYNQNSIIVKTVLEHMRKIGILDDYKAIRIEGNNSTNQDYLLTEQRLKFKSGNRQSVYFDMVPPVQVCVYDKSVLNEDFKVIFPDEYNIDYAV